MSGPTGIPRSRPRLLLRFAVLLGAPPAVLTAAPREATGPFWGPILRRAAVLFVPISVAVTVGVWLTFLVTVDVGSRSAFAPQAQTASDAAARLEAGADARSVVPGYRIDLGASQYPYVMVYDRSGQLVASSADLDGRPVALPPAVFDYVRTGLERHDSTWYAVYAGAAPWILWTPRPGAASAVVVEPWSGGFVVAGRSAEPPTVEFAVAWALTLAATAAACVLVGLVHPLNARSAPPRRDGGGGGGGPDRDPGPRPQSPQPREYRPHGFRPLVRRRRRSRPRISPR